MAVEKTTVARPYAEAIFSLADQSDGLEQWSGMLSLLAALVSDAKLARLIGSPEMDHGRKEAMMVEIAGEHLSPQGANLVRLLVQNKRLNIVPEIAQLFEELKNQREGSIDVSITSAYAVNKTLEKKLSEALKEKLSKDVRITIEKDPSLIGGVKIRANDLVIDGSIRNKLSRLATEFGI